MRKHTLAYQPDEDTFEGTFREDEGLYECEVWLGHPDDEGGEHKCVRVAGHLPPHDSREESRGH